jgi:hypothetical protein
LVKIFLKGSPTPAATIPLPPLEAPLGAPCLMFYAADVRWPAQQEIGSLPDGGTPPADVIPADAGTLAKFGKRVGQTCAPDVPFTRWFSQQP